MTTTAAADLLSRANSDIAAFRVLTIKLLVEAGYRFAAELIENNRWPTESWQSITYWSERTPPPSKPTMHAQIEKTAKARDHLVALAAAHGLRFHFDDTRGHTVMVTLGAEWIEVGDWDVADHNGKLIKDPLGNDPVMYFVRKAEDEKTAEAIARSKGELQYPLIHARRAAWYRMAAEFARKDRDGQ